MCLNQYLNWTIWNKNTHEVRQLMIRNYFFHYFSTFSIHIKMKKKKNLFSLTKIIGDSGSDAFYYWFQDMKNEKWICFFQSFYFSMWNSWWAELLITKEQRNIIYWIYHLDLKKANQAIFVFLLWKCEEILLILFL